MSVSIGFPRIPDAAGNVKEPRKHAEGEKRRGGERENEDTEIQDKMRHAKLFALPFSPSPHFLFSPSFCLLPRVLHLLAESLHLR
jgi:hypothetical protein